MIEQKEQISTMDLIKKRPLSPHLTIYKPQITSMLSISHRISGFFLYFGLVVFCWLLFSFAFCSECSGCYFKFFSDNIFGKLMVFGWSLAFFYHFCNGIRHLFWDIGQGFEIKMVEKSGWVVIMLTLLLTFISWGIVFNLI